MNKHNAKYWLMDSEFTSTFKEYVLPDAVTRFRQGLGRLIRNENDRGIIANLMIDSSTVIIKTFLNKHLKIIVRKKATFNSLENY